MYIYIYIYCCIDIYFNGLCKNIGIYYNFILAYILRKTSYQAHYSCYTSTRTLSVSSSKQDILFNYRRFIDLETHGFFYKKF